MIKQTQSLYEARAAIIKALAHPTRLFIVEMLQKRDYNVGELVEMIGADFSTVSKHLTTLKNSGLVSDERKGTTIYYHLKTPCILNFIGCVEEVLQINADEKLNVLSYCRK
ncbi:MAG: helix-turn-helix transcriptional regulator [Spirochaetes bacterium]|nr:helix-turn-helix transcriptional regulator [Spirochaetota bacterium]